MAFIYKFITFFIIFGLVLYFLWGLVEFSTDLYTNSDISTLHELRSKRKYDLLIMGTSHARMFGVSGHRQQVSSVLGKRMLSLANIGSGVIPQKIFLELFYEKENEVREILYFIDPWVLYSNAWNEADYYITGEVFRVEYLGKLIANGFEPEVIKEYLRKKISYKLFIYPISRKKVFNEEITNEDYKNLEKLKEERFQLWYPTGTNKAEFDKYAKELEKIVELANEHGSRVVFVIPPALFEDLPGRIELLDYLALLQKKYRIKFYDYSQSVKERDLYLNMDHLNEKGVIHFSEQYLKPVLMNSQDNK